MRVERADEHVLRVLDLADPGVPPGPALDPIQLLMCALARCTWSVLAAYGERLGVGADDVVVTLRWRLVEGPRRVDDVQVDIRWPALPASRLDAATRAARHCTVHTTLTRGMSVDVLVDH